MRIGFTTAGTIEAFRDESLTTRFFYIGLLFFPVSSHYQHARGTLDVPMHGRSVGIGMLRLYSGVAAFLATILVAVGIFGHGAEVAVVPGAVTVIVALPLCAYSLCVASKPSPGDLARREVLRSVVGMGALPTWLDHEQVKKLHRSLLADWDAQRRAWDEPADWTAAVKAGPRSPAAARLLAAIAAYDAALRGKNTDISARAWERALSPAAPAQEAAPAQADEASAAGDKPALAGRLSVRCAECKTIISVAARHAGKRVRCECGATARVPGQKLALAA